MAWKTAVEEERPVRRGTLGRSGRGGIFFRRRGEREPYLPPARPPPQKREREREEKRGKKIYIKSNLAPVRYQISRRELRARLFFLRETSPPAGDSTSDSAGFT